VGSAFNVYIFAGHDTNSGTDLDYFTLAVPANATKVGVSFTNNSTSQLPQSYSIDTTGGTYSVKFTANTNSTVASSLTLTPQ